MSASDSPKAASGRSGSPPRVIRVQTLVRTYDVAASEDDNVIRAGQKLVNKAREIYLPSKEETRGFTFLDWWAGECTRSWDWGCGDRGQRGCRPWCGGMRCGRYCLAPQRPS